MRPIKNAKKIDYNLIKVFDTVITEGNATRAARKLDVTPAAISQALLRLQNLYGEELFIRTRKGLVPSSKGKSLHQIFRQAIESIESTLCDKTDLRRVMNSLFWEVISLKITIFQHCWILC